MCLKISGGNCLVDPVWLRAWCPSLTIRCFGLLLADSDIRVPLPKTFLTLRLFLFYLLPFFLFISFAFFSFHLLFSFFISFPFFLLQPLLSAPTRVGSRRTRRCREAKKRRRRPGSIAGPRGRCARTIASAARVGRTNPSRSCRHGNNRRRQPLLR